MTEAAMTSAKAPRKLTGRDVLMTFVAFFGVVFAVNAYFLHSALSTYSGVVSAEPYRKGLHYNQRIAAESRQNALGWKENIALDRDGKLVVTMAGTDGQPVRNLALTATIARPSTAQFDRVVKLAETEPGHYMADAKAIPSGSWIVSLQTQDETENREPTYRARRRLWLNP